MLTQSLLWRQLDRNHGRDANQCRRGREKDWGRLAVLGGVPAPGCGRTTGSTSRPQPFGYFFPSKYFTILVMINRDAQWNQSDTVWDRVLNFENFLKAITLSCIYD